MAVGSSEVRRSYDAFISYSRRSDDALAAAVQQGLRELAKPWFRRQALRVFRDQTSLSASPELWGSIETALKDSRYLVLILSPVSSSSPWVRREVAWWRAHRSAEFLIMVLADRVERWDAQACDFVLYGSTEATPVRGYFASEPLWVDASFASEVGSVSNEDPRLQEVVANIAAPMHGRSKDELIGEDIRAHRRVRLLVRAVLAVLTALTLLVAGAAVVAVQQRSEAVQQRSEAVQQRSVAVKQRNRAVAERRIAVSRQLAAQAVSLRESSPAWSLVASLEALGQAETAEAHASLTSTLATTHLERVLRRNGPPALTGAWGATGQQLVVGNDDGSLEMWTVVGGQIHEGWRTPATNVRPHTMAIAPDGKLLAVGDEYGSVRLWSLVDGKEPVPLGVVPGGMDDWHRVAFDPNSGALLTVGSTVQIWDVSHLSRLRRVVELAPGTVRDAAFTADGRGVVVAADPGVTGLYDLSAPGRSVWKLPGAFGVAVSPDGRALVTVPRDQDAVVWQLDAVRSPTRVAALIAPSSDPADAAAFDGSGRTLAVSQYDGTTTVWDLSEVTLPHQVASLAGHVSAVAEPVVAPDGRQVVTLGQDGVVNLWTTGAGQAASLAGTWGPFEAVPDSVAFAAHDTLVVGSEGNAPTIWDISDLASVRRIGVVPMGHQDFPSTWALSVSPDGGTLAASDDSSTTLWAINRRHLRRLATVAGSNATFGPRQMLATDAEDTTTLWDLRDPESPAEVADLDGGRAAFSEDGHLMSTSDAEKTQLWDISATPPQARGAVPGRSASFDGAAVIGTAGDDEALLWDVHDPSHPEKLSSLPAHGIQEGPAFYPGGGLAATGTSGAAPTLWDIVEPSAPVRLATLQGHHGSVYNLTFSADGTLLATSSYDRYLKLWDVRRLGESLSDPARAACFIIGEELPPNAWQTMFPDIPYRDPCGQPVDP